MNKRSRTGTQGTVRTLTSFFSPARTPVIPPRPVEVEPEGPEPQSVQPEEVEIGVSNVNADNAEDEEICSNDPNVAFNDGDIVADPGLRIAIENMHPNIRGSQMTSPDIQKEICQACAEQTTKAIISAAGGGTDTKAAFAQIYSTLKEELLADPAFEFTAESHQWIDRMIDYTVLGGKCNRGLSVVDSYKLLKGADVLGEEELFLACTLGWCIEWLQAFFLVLDDIMDGSHTRRGQPCWFRVPQVGFIAVNDGVILRNHICRILKRHFKGKPYYADLVDLFNEVEFKTASGQLLDLITTHEGEKDLTKYNITVHRRIVQYKTAYYSFYLPVACALLLSGENLENYGAVENILVEMGTYFQVQDDYLDCYGDPEFIGKIGTDIEDYKCSWLVVQALERANESQKCILFENYGKKDADCVAKVKNLYKELNLEAVFQEYESESYKKLIADIEAQPSIAVQNVLKSFLHKIYKRQK